MLLRVVWLLCLAAAFLGVYPVKAQYENLTVDDVRSAYQQNFLSIFPWRVDIRHSVSQTQIELQGVAAELGKVNAILSDPDISEQQRTSLALNRDKLQRRLESLGNKDTHYLYRMYIDGTGFQLQVPLEFANGVGDENSTNNFTFVDGMPTVDTLEMDYTDYMLFSCSTSNSIYLTWKMGGKGFGQGWISDSPFSFKNSQYKFPPMGTIRDSWSSAGLFGILDSLILYPREQYASQGVETIDGVPLMRIEHTANRPFAPQVGLPEGAHEMQDRTIIWIDPSRGFLPVRIEEGERSLFNGRVVNAGHNAPDRVIEVLETHKFNDSYIPSRLRINYYKTYSDKRITGVPTPAEFRQGKTFDFPRVVYMQEVLSLDNILLLTKDALQPFDFKFPFQTRYFDKRIGRSMIVGMTAEELDERTLAAFPPLAKDPGTDLNSAWSSRGFWISLNVIVVCVLLFAILCLRRSRTA